MKVNRYKAWRLAGAAVLAAGASTLAVPALAFAAETESAGISAILPDMAEFIPMLVAFIVLVVVLAKFGWPKFDAMLQRREDTIKDALEKSEQDRIESERILQEYKKQLEDAKSQASQIVAEAKATGIGSSLALILILRSSRDFFAVKVWSHSDSSAPGT